ncbi:MAG: glycosyl hydrolase family 18 protein [Planctomycetota bacterium]
MARTLPPAVVAAVVGLLAAGSALAQERTSRSVHAAQIRELGDEAHQITDDAREALALEAAARRSAGASTSGPVPALAEADTRLIGRRSGGIADDAIVFGYLQSEAQVFHLRWHALTHVGSRFVGFDSSGRLTSTSAFTGRSSYLKAGGAADVAGVRFVLVLANFDDGPGGSLERVMTSPSRRATLVSELVQILANDSYSHGVSLDLEFLWGPSVRDGVTAFCRELRAGLDTLGPDYELSIYTNAIFSSNQWDFDAETGITPEIDYMLYSMYDWASGSTARAISNLDNCLASGRMRGYLDDGLPPEKLVPVISAYSRRWSNTTVYGGSGSNATSSGFTDAVYDVTLNPSIGPVAERYVRGDEAGWYSWFDGLSRVRTFDSPEAMEVEIRNATSFLDPSGEWSGRRLGGVGFWSLMWMAESTSIDPRTGSSVSRTRTYPAVYSLCSEILSEPGQTLLPLERFDGLDFRWRDPNESPDTIGDVDGNSSRAVVPAPSGGQGSGLRIVWDFEGGSTNRAVFAHEVLASPIAPQIADTNAVLGRVDPAVRLVAPIFVESPSPDSSIRMLVVDARGELEASRAFPLGAAGWRTIEWNLDDVAQTRPYTTTEPAFQSGNGSIDVAGSIHDDVGFYGFVVEGEGPVSGALLIDEIAYEPVDPGGRAYRINEFRTADPSAEFVEIHGPTGPLPFGLALRVYSSADASVRAQFPLGGAIPDDGGGSGFFVAGDLGVPNVDVTGSFIPGFDDLPNVAPASLQLVDTFTGHVYDSVVYAAFGGLDQLVRPQANDVTANGWPWIGAVASGADETGAAYAMGRFPDGLDTHRNREDFSFQRATPGEANGRALQLPASFDFETPVTAAFQTFDAPRRSDPMIVSILPSNDGGLAWRCVDEDGGGVVGAIGDAALGRSRGHRVSGELFVPRSTAPAQAVAVGVCGSQGSHFFSSAPGSNGYESGYWLVYENRAGVGLGNGREDHPGTWELLHATNDNMDGEPVELLASLPNFILGVTDGTWVRFEFVVRPRAAQDERLVVIVEGQELYRGPLPKGGPTSGAFQVGWRENHPGPPNTAEGTWIDGLVIEEL